MKNVIRLMLTTLLCALLFLGFASSAWAADVAINDTNFPDANFRSYVSSYIDKDGNVSLSAAEIASVTELYLYNKSIRSLGGIEYFTALTYLECSKNMLTSLDVSHNTALTSLSCSGNRLTSLDVSRSTALSSLSCDSNRLTSLDVRGNTALSSLSCGSNRLTSLDVSSNTALSSLSCNSNQLTSLDVSSNTALSSLSCYSNRLTSLDVSGNTALRTLQCNSNQLTSLDVSGNTALSSLSCYSNRLTSLDVSHNTALNSIVCWNNQLTNLDISRNTALISLQCYSNPLASLDISYCADLLWLVENTEPTTAINRIEYGNPGSSVLSYSPGVTLITDPDAVVTITFRPNEADAAGQMEAQPVNRNEAAALCPCAFTRAGYIFDGWNTEADGSGTSYADGETVTFSANTTLYAQWREGYTVSFDKNAADATGTIKPLTAPRGERITLPYSRFSRPNYIFKAWNTRTDGTGTVYHSGAALTPDADMTLYAQWGKSLRIRYFSNGTGTAAATIGVAEGSTIPIESFSDFDITPPTGKVFDSWNTKPDGSGTSYVPGDVVTMTADLDLYPQWKDEAPLTEVVTINSSTFPDVVFRLYVSEQLDTNGNGSLSNREIAAVTALTLRNKEIISLKGIEYFTELATLNCDSNYLKALDLSSNTRLYSLNCGWNRLTALNLRGCDRLTTLACGDNQLTSLDLGTCPALQSLTCYRNNLSTLELSDNDALQSLSCYGNQLTSLNLSNCSVLTTVNCSDNQLTELNLAGNSSLMSLYCGGNQLTALNLGTLSQLAYLNCANNRLTSLELSGNTALTTLYCGNNQLMRLNLSGNTVLAALYCGANHLTGLELGSSAVLTTLDCSENRLMSLNLQDFAALESLSCYGNHMTSLNIDGCTALTALQCQNNQLTELNLINNTFLLGLSCQDNLLSNLDIRPCQGLTMLCEEFEPQNKNGVISYGATTGGSRRYLSFDADVDLIIAYPQPDFTLPAALTTIGEEAFVGGAFTCVKLPDGAVSIGTRAFADCPNLAYIYIPASVTSIDTSAFGDMPSLTVIGTTGSTAQTFARDHGFRFFPSA